MEAAQTMVQQIRDSAASGFYRELWGAKRGFSELPAVSRDDFERVPLSKRRYKNERALVKIVRGAQKKFLSEWSFADIGRESYGLPAERPMVYLSDPYEAIEKSMWCYEQGMVPLVGEKDPDIAMFAAGKYQIDSLITDPEAIVKLRPYLEMHRLSSISVIGGKIDPGALAPFSSYADTLRLVLALPEIGAFAEASYAPKPAFSALPGCIIGREDTLIVTKERMLVTPVVKFKTRIDASLYGGM